LHVQFRVRTKPKQWGIRFLFVTENALKTGNTMNLSLNIGPIVALIAGILILLVPRLLNYIVAVYLIVIGLIGLFGMGSVRI
jgi:Protein of unknown function (DUF3096)